MVNIISDYIPPFSPLPNIAPFTYKDGETYLSTLYNLSTFINTTLIDNINTNSGTNLIIVNGLVTTVNAQLVTMQTYVDQAVASIINNSISITDAAMLTVLNNAISNVRVLLNTLYASNATQVTVETGRLSDVTLNTEFASKSIETIVTSGRLSDITLQTEFALKSVETIVTSGRLSDITLQTEFALKAIETIVTSGRLTTANLNIAYAPVSIYNGQIFKRYATYAAALAAITSFTVNDIIICDDTPGATYKIVASALIMDGIARFASAAASLTAIAAPIIGMRRKRADALFTEEYFTGANGVAVAGWYPTTGITPFVFLGTGANQSVSGSGNNTAIVWDVEKSDIVNWHDPANPTKITVQIAGHYRITAHLSINTNTAGHFIAGDIAVNGSALLHTSTLFPVTSGVGSVSWIGAVDVILAVNDYIEFRASDTTSTPIITTNSMLQLQYISPA